MKHKKIMIYAYTNFNLGDDLFIKMLCERYPETHFILYAPNEYKSYFNGLSNIIIYSRNNILYRFVNYILRKMKIGVSVPKIIESKTDAVVRIGGSIFMQKDDWNDLNINKKTTVEKPFFVLGANFGPFTDPLFYKQHHELFKNYTDICFRDNYSYKLFKDLDNVRQADDIVFHLDKKFPFKKENNIVISVIKPSYRKDLKDYDNVYFQKLKEIIEFFIQKDYKITLMSFCENEGDQEAIENIIKLIDPKMRESISKYFYKKNIDEALEIISSSLYVIATRFHAMILGWVYNKPVFPISYSNKMNNVMDDINYCGTYVDLKKIKSLKIEDVYDGINKNIVDISPQVKNAELHFKKLDKLLLNNK